MWGQHLRIFRMQGEWNKEDIRDKYGLGHGLKQLKMWLDKIVLIPL